MSKENEIKDIIDLLNEVGDDRTVPRNIRATAANAIEKLNDESKDASLRASEAISLLDDISTDLNMPVHARTKIWNIVGMLESVQR